MQGCEKGLEEQREKGISPCFIGTTRQSECHVLSQHYKGESVLKSIGKFSSEQQLLLSRRSDVIFSDTSKICSYHEAMFLTKYELFQKTCCNPFLKDGHNCVKSLRVINVATADLLKTVTKRDFQPGQKLCPRCTSDLAAFKFEEAQGSDDEPMNVAETVDPDEQMNVAETVNSSLTRLGISPLKFQAVSRRDSHGYAKRKISQAQDVITCQIALSGGLEPNDFILSSTSACRNCVDYELLIGELKEKFRVSNRFQQVQILTLAPASWSKHKIMTEFGASDRMVKQAQKLKKHVGVLAVPSQKAGKKLSEQVQSKVQAFYEDDEFSRLCPGKKDYVSVRLAGGKVQKQKRLLLCNLKELFTSYRLHNGPEIGFSKFCELRPKWCVTVGSAGAHSVCVCKSHQNVKLMLAASPVQEDYKELMNEVVCSLESKNCMLHRCEECPGKGHLEEYLANVFQDYDAGEDIKFKQWIHTDRDMLDNRHLSVEEFVPELSSKIFELTSHHYVAKHQSFFLKSRKESLQPGELIVLMDFAENYSFIVQDAVQGFHWVNSQATLHPFVCYYKHTAQQEVQSSSFCVISDCVRHDTVAVHVFITKLLPHLKDMFPQLKHIDYFSDGSAAQYKNYKNFINLCLHEKDFHIGANWNFFGTSHGKSPCDGIGGTAKRLAAHASLQRPMENQILTPIDLFNFCDQNISGVKFFFVPKKDIEVARPFQDERFKRGRTVAGTRENHQFIPVGQSSIQISRVSNDVTSFVANLYETDLLVPGLKVSELQPGQYVACAYDSHWWIGNICEISSEERDALITFMHPHGPAVSFHWPVTGDRCWIPEEHIISMLSAPKASSMGRQYSYCDAVLLNINQVFRSSMQ